MKRSLLGHVVISSLLSPNIRPVRPCFVVATPFMSRLAAFAPLPNSSSVDSRRLNAAGRFSAAPPRPRRLHRAVSMSSVPTKRKRPSETGALDPSGVTGVSATTGERAAGSRLSACPKCLGEGQARTNRSKKARAQHRRVVDAAAAAGMPKPPPPPPRMAPCKACSGSGLVLVSDGTDDYDDDCAGGAEAAGVPPVDPNARVAVVGGGIGGFALALALQHRGVPCDVYERDGGFDERSQGYGLTMQQGARAIKSLGLTVREGGAGDSGDDAGKEGGGEDDDGEVTGEFGIHSKRHVVHKTDGTVVGQWGMKVWGRPETKAKNASRQNAHISRQELRRKLMERLHSETVHWGCQLVGYRELQQSGGEESGKNVEITLVCQNDRGESEKIVKHASVLVGADGIRSVVRDQKIGDEASPLKYLGCIVILGISQSPEHDLTDGETVFQTADGTTRIYAMPFAKPGKETAGAANFTSAAKDGDGQTSGRYHKGETMWQLSFPIDEAAAKDLSRRGPEALKTEALKRCGLWHEPVPSLLRGTPTALVSGYPVYDRDLPEKDLLRCGNAPETSDETNKVSRVTLIGDAAHPMSPFKGQGANQALLDAVLLARGLYNSFMVTDALKGRRKYETVTVEDSLVAYEKEMLSRSAAKVQRSAAAADFLHSDIAIAEGNFPRCTAAGEVP